MIIWDTNTVYYISGKSTSDKCDAVKVLSFAKNERTCISSMTACEIICHYKNHAKYVRHIFSSLRNNNIGIILHPLLPDSRMCIAELSYIKQSELEKSANDAIAKKIVFESAYAFSMFFAVFASALWFSLPDALESYDIIAKLLVVWRDTNGDKCRETFKQAFEYGYKINDCEKVVKSVFEYMLFDDLHCFQPLAIEIMNNIGKKTISELLDSKELSDSSNVFQKMVQKSGTTTQYVKKLAIKYRKREGTTQYLSFLDNMHTVFENTFRRSAGILHDSMYKYFIDISTRILENGGLFNKNDIIDGLILQHLYVDASDKILTFDGGMIKHLTKYASSEQTYKNGDSRKSC